MPESQIVFVGLGLLGSVLIRHLAPVANERRVALLVNDLDREAANRVAADHEGVTAIETLADVPNGETVLCLCVTNAAAVTSVVEAAIAAGVLISGSVVLDFSSVPPAFAAATAEQLAANGVKYIDAPLTGGMVAARSGTMVTMAGGDQGALDRVDWIARTFSQKVVWTGKSGNGALLKTINNWIGNSAAVAAIEGLVILRHAGLSNEAILSVLNNGPAATYFSMSRYPRYLTDREAPSGAELGLVTKDLHIAEEAAKQAGATPVLSLLAASMWQGAVTKYGTSGDMLQMLDYVSRSTFGKSWEEIDAD